MNKQNLILSSSSLNRKELLTRLKIPFTSLSPEIDESQLQDESPVQTARRLAKLKALKTVESLANINLEYKNAPTIIIGSDQVAFREEGFFDKPMTVERALAQLQKMQGRAISFYTAMHVIKVESVTDGESQNYKITQELFGGVMTNVVFRKLTLEQIRRYVEVDNPLSCAGSARCESLGIALLSSVESSDPSALIGLPLIMLSGFLEEMGMAVL